MTTLNSQQILEKNQEIYEEMYTREQAFLRYPADWVIRFHNMYMRDNIPSGRILDYGCGSANNAIFFMDQGYEVTGVDTAESALPLIKANLERNKMDPALINRFSVIPADTTSLPYEAGYFDFILSNQVLYYLASEEQIKAVCKEFSRCLRPGGAVFFTMMGPNNYYIRYHTKQVHGGRVYEVGIDDPAHRITGSWGLNFLVRDEEELVDLFSEFECVTTGYFDQKMFDMKSNYHWIFAGRKPS